MEQYRERFSELLLRYLEESYQADFDWFNLVGSSHDNNIKRCHLEHYTNSVIEVIHIVVTPAFHTDMPIFGFDIIAINGKVTFVCGDLTPTVNRSYRLYTEFESNRDRPKWGAFFSDTALFYEPKPEEVDELFSEFFAVLYRYLSDLSKAEFCAEPSKVLLKVNEYNNEQRKNNKTYKALAAAEGDDVAEKFIKEVLFPEFGYDRHDIYYQNIINKGRYVKEKTQKEHAEAEKTLFSQSLLRGHPKWSHYYDYLNTYKSLFEVLLQKSNDETSTLFYELFKADLLECEEMHAVNSQKPQSLIQYCEYLSNISPEKAESHKYVIALGHTYGGQYIARKMGSVYPKRHLTELPDKIAHKLRESTSHVTPNEASLAYSFIKQIYKEIWQRT